MTEPWQQTFTGGAFWFLEPSPGDVVLEDIAHALALQCRFAGHCKTHYSVGQHSIEVATIVEPRYMKEALFHDAAEAYLNDITKPVKESRICAGYEEAEHQISTVIAERFGLIYPWPDEVIEADDIILATEARDLMAKPPMDWHLKHAPRALPIVPWRWEDTEQIFLALTRFVLEEGT